MARGGIPFSGVDAITQPGTIQVPGDLQRVDANPAAFGAGIGAAARGFGQQVENAGGEMFSAAIKQQQFERQTAVTDSLNQFQDQLRQIRYGSDADPNDRGYTGQTGKAAVDGYNDAVKNAQDVRQTLLETVSDPVTREMVDKSSRRLMGSTLDAFAAHRQQQAQVSAVQTAQRGVQLSQQNAVLSYDNDDEFKNHLADVVRLQGQADQAAGASPEVAEFNQRKAVSDTVASRVMRIAADDPLKANAYLNDYLKTSPGGMLPDQQTHLIDTLHAQVRTREAGQLGGGVAAGMAAPAGALPPDQRDQVLDQATSGTMVPKPLLNALITQESRWDPAAKGGGSDTGLGQITDGTAADPGYGMEPISREDRLDPAKNAKWTARYLEARGKAVGLTSPEDWQNRQKVSRALQAYNGGGDPNYVQNVLRHMTGPQIASAGSDQGAAAPVQPIQTQADYYRTNYDSLLDQAREQARQLHPGDQQFEDLAVANTQQRLNKVITTQERAYKADSDLLWQAANGDLAKGIAPGSVDELTKASPAVQQAWQRVQVQQPQLAHAIATRVLSQNARPDDKDAKTYGDAFPGVFARIHAKDGDPNKLTDPDQLYSMLGQGLTMAGIEKARGEIAGRRTPEGEAESAMRAAFFRNAKAEISGADDGLGLKDPKGDQIYLRFMAKAYDQINAARAAGKSASAIYDPDSPDYVGKVIPQFRRTLAQRTADMLGASGETKPPEQPGFFGKLFGGAAPDLTTPEGIRAAVAAGKMTRAEAIQRLTRPALPVAATE